MINRYSLSPMKEIWTQEAQYERWLEVELALIKTYEELGIAPQNSYKNAKKNSKIDVEEILKIESEVRHDVIAFIKSVTENMNDEARYFHMGLTSSDVIDTALSLAMKQSLELIIDKLNEFIKVLKILAKKYKNTITLGRTHGIHAEPTSFGLKWLSYLSEAERNRERLEKTLEDISQGKLSGAVGNYANIDPSVEKKVLEKLSLMPCKISTQIVPRDIHAEFLYNLSLLGAGIERIALEIRHLQRSEVQEAFEPFTKGQRGSSAMPHKKNPIISERLCGMARLLRSNADAAAENIALWHERDISHSSIERIIIPDSCLIAFYMLEKVTWMVEGIDVKEDQMIEQFKRSYNLVFSQRVMLTLVSKGFSREDAYKLTQKVALECWNSKKDFKEEIKKVNDDEHYFSKNEIEDIFNPTYFLKNISKIYERFNFEDEE